MTTIRMTKPAEIASAIPLMVGYQPTTDTFILVHAEPRGRTILTGRLDSDMPAADFALQIRHVLDAASRSGKVPTRLTIVRYESTLLGSPDHHAVAAAVAFTDGLRLEESLSIAGGRWSSYICGNDECCPAGGTPVDGRSAAVTSFIAAGQSDSFARPERVAFDGDALLGGAGAELEGWPALLAAPADGPVLLALAAAVCGTYARRDALIADAARLDWPALRSAVDLTYALLRSLPATDPRLPMVASVAAWLTLMVGGGVLVRRCLERIPAGAVPPLGELALAAHEAGIAPAELSRISAA